MPIPYYVYTQYKLQPALTIGTQENLGQNPRGYHQIAYWSPGVIISSSGGRWAALTVSNCRLQIQAATSVIDASVGIHAAFERRNSVAILTDTLAVSAFFPDMGDYGIWVGACRRNVDGTLTATPTMSHILTNVRSTCAVARLSATSALLVYTDSQIHITPEGNQGTQPIVRSCVLTVDPETLAISVGPSTLVMEQCYSGIYLDSDGPSIYEKQYYFGWDLRVFGAHGFSDGTAVAIIYWEPFAFGAFGGTRTTKGNYWTYFYSARFSGGQHTSGRWFYSQDEDFTQYVNHKFWYPGEEFYRIYQGTVSPWDWATNVEIRYIDNAKNSTGDFGLTAFVEQIGTRFSSDFDDSQGQVYGRYWRVVKVTSGGLAMHLVHSQPPPYTQYIVRLAEIPGTTFVLLAFSEGLEINKESVIAARLFSGILPDKFTTLLSPNISGLQGTGIVGNTWLYDFFYDIAFFDNCNLLVLGGISPTQTSEPYEKQGELAHLLLCEGFGCMAIAAATPLEPYYDQLFIVPTDYWGGS